MQPENQAEANVIKSVLEDHGIYAEIKSFHDTAYDGLFQSQYGWGVRTKVAVLDPDKNLIGHATEKSGTNFTATADKCLSISLKMAGRQRQRQSGSRSLP